MESTTTWLVTIGILSAVIAFDLILAILRRNKETSMREAAIWTGYLRVGCHCFWLLHA